MANYKFDGSKLKLGGKTIANVRRDKICEGTGSKCLANIRGDKICEGTGSKCLANVRGDKICEGTGSKKIGTIKDAQKAIDGPGGKIITALWYLFAR